MQSVLGSWLASRPCSLQREMELRRMQPCDAEAKAEAERDDAQRQSDRAEALANWRCGHRSLADLEADAAKEEAEEEVKRQAWMEELRVLRQASLLYDCRARHEVKHHCDDLCGHLDSSDDDDDPIPAMGVILLEEDGHVDEALLAEQDAASKSVARELREMQLENLLRNQGHRRALDDDDKDDAEPHSASCSGGVQYDGRCYHWDWIGMAKEDAAAAAAEKDSKAAEKTGP